VPTKAGESPANHEKSSVLSSSFVKLRSSLAIEAFSSQLSAISAFSRIFSLTESPKRFTFNFLRFTRGKPRQPRSSVLTMDESPAIILLS